MMMKRIPVHIFFFGVVCFFLFLIVNPHHAVGAPVNLSVSKTGSGTVISTIPAGINCDTGNTDCNEMYEEGTIITLTAMPDAGYHFGGWTAGCVSEALSCKVALNAATNVHATFTLGPPSPVTWSKSLGGGLTSNQYLYAIQQTSDGGYIGAGRAYNTVSYYDEFYVVKLFEDGSVDWERMYSLPLYMNKASSIQQTAEGGYIVAGSVRVYVVFQRCLDCKARRERRHPVGTFL